MDGILYPISLAVLALMAFGLLRNNKSFLAFAAVLVAVYIVYTHETGKSAADIRSDIDKSAVDFIKKTANE